MKCCGAWEARSGTKQKPPRAEGLCRAAWGLRVPPAVPREHPRDPSWLVLPRGLRVPTRTRALNGCSWTPNGVTEPGGVTSVVPPHALCPAMGHTPDAA